MIEFQPDPEIVVCRVCGEKWDDWHEKHLGHPHLLLNVKRKKRFWRK